MGFQLFHHFTESLDEVHDYLRDLFGSDDLEMLDVGADIRIADKFIELKSCNEFNKDTYANGGRRRGRYHFGHPVNADFVVFLLIRENGRIEKRSISADYVEKEILKCGLRTVIPYREIFC